MKALDQELFDSIFKLSAERGYDTKIRLPEVAYTPTKPFVVIGEVQIVPKKTNTKLLGRAFVTVDVWGKKRRDVSAVVEDLRATAQHIELSRHWLYQSINASNYRIIEDTSTPTSLWHGVITLEFTIR